MASVDVSQYLSENEVWGGAKFKLNIQHGLLFPVPLGMVLNIKLFTSGVIKGIFIAMFSS